MTRTPPAAGKFQAIRQKFPSAAAAFGCAAALLSSTGMLHAAGADTFAWLRPAVALDAAAHGQLDRGEVIARVLPAADGELGVFVAARLDAEGDTLVAWGRAIEQLKRSRFVLGVRRFSDPPSPHDLQALTLDDTDLDDLRRCKPADCGLKLSADEMILLRRVADESGPLWKDAVQEQFRHVVFSRVVAYRSEGFAALKPYVDRRRPMSPQSAFASLLERSPYLESPPFVDADTDSFFYWSKEQYGAGKPVISVTHVDIVRPRMPGAVQVALVSREILATHYRNASLGLTAVTEDASGRHYLVYVNRSQLDVLGGIFGGWKRAIVEGRLKKESADVFNEIRRRLESGPPPE